MFKKIKNVYRYMTLTDIKDFANFFIDKIYYPDFVEVVPKLQS